MNLTMNTSGAEPTVFRNKTNRFWGAGLIGIFAVGWLLSDPLMLRGVPLDVPPADRITSQDAAVFSWVLAVVSGLVLALLWYPCVEVSDEEVVIKNPLLTTSIPKETITAVDESKTYLRVIAAGKSYICIGLEKSLAMAVRDASDSSTALATAAIPETPTPTSEEPSRSLRRPTVVEIVVILVWFSLGAIALVKG
ncbi:hypothetical protein GCM10029976_032120 [Kribbella albertanoniae]|uniref:PH domain-containing protein n=1 Tax=Kribbella albertanoniae TaxID=1266829 RepID=A0A4R4QH65_9ACTN|nr:hypothetical protein [Kribbella albertanoniae]TDC34977.1 hypothetical protein E1261_02005 [Kribbella albertanoniae]